MRHCQRPPLQPGHECRPGWAWAQSLMRHCQRPPIQPGSNVRWGGGIFQSELAQLVVYHSQKVQRPLACNVCLGMGHEREE